MELRYIKTFLALSEELHFGRTATRLGIVQPAVSQHIRALEEELGVELFARTKRKVELTAAGVALIAPLREVLDALARAASAAQRAAAGQLGRVRVGYTMLSVLGALPAALAAFGKARADVRVELLPMSAAAQVEALRAGALELGVTAAPFIAPGELEQRVIESFPLMVALPSAHPLAAEEQLSAEQLPGERVILMSREADPTMQRFHEEMCAAAGVTQPLAAEVERLEALLAFVEAGLGISYVPASVSRQKPAGVALVPLSPAQQLRTLVMWAPGELSPARDALLDALAGAASASSV